MKLYTKEQLLKKFKNKYIEVYRHYDYSTKESTFEVRSIKKECWENHNLPEDIISWYN